METIDFTTTRGPAMIPDFNIEHLRSLVEQGHDALNSRFAPDRVTMALAVLPMLVQALSEILQRQDRLMDLRLNLTSAVRELRETVWQAQKMDPSITFANAHVHRVLRRVNGILVEIDKELFGV